MDPQIGSDIAKLLGNLGKSTGSSSNSAASSDAGTAFKRALAASRQAQAEQTSGNELPVQPSRSEAPQQRGSGSVAVTERGNSIAAQAPSDQVATVAWPGFDLQLVGSPSQQLDVLKFAKEAGLSEEVLAQLFPQNGATSVDLKATSKELAESVVTAINEWVTAAVEQPITSDAAVDIPDDTYETDPEVIPYCELHYGDEYFGVDNYPEKLAQIALNYAQGKQKGKALNVGCKTGRSAFELAVEFENVTGIDFTARMIRIGVELKDKGYTQYVLPEEGEIVSFHQKNLQELGLDGARSKVEFMQADISNMKDLFSGYDLILVDSTLECAYNPRKFLEGVHRRLNSNGLLIIASSYAWDESKTDRNQWLGGFKVDGENTTTLDALESLLSPNFKRIEEPIDVDQVIRKTRRTYDHNVLQVTI